MNTCSLFGHRMVLEEIEDILKETLEELIETHGVTMFYVGNNGNFDATARRALIFLKKKYFGVDYNEFVGTGALDGPKPYPDNITQPLPHRPLLDFRPSSVFALRQIHLPPQGEGWYAPTDSISPFVTKV